LTGTHPIEGQRYTDHQNKYSNRSNQTKDAGRANVCAKADRRGWYGVAISLQQHCSGSSVTLKEPGAFGAVRQVVTAIHRLRCDAHLIGDPS
jgi:hypothetical protein